MPSSGGLMDENYPFLAVLAERLNLTEKRIFPILIGVGTRRVERARPAKYSFQQSAVDGSVLWLDDRVGRRRGIITPLDRV